MNIHHAIVKSAAAKGVILSVVDEAPLAHVPAHGVHVQLEDTSDGDQTAFNDLAKDAWSIALDIVAFHEDTPNIRVRQYPDTDFVAYRHADGEDGEELARDPDFADLLETLSELPEDDAAEEAGDEAPTANVVPIKYKQKYAAEGHPDHCGDWLAVTLNDLCHVMTETDGKLKTKFSVDKLEAINAANGLDTAKYLVNQNRGWEGRYRMTTRNMLAKVVAGSTVLYVPDGVGGEGDRELEAPADWCAKFAPKPKAPAASKKPAAA